MSTSHVVAEAVQQLHGVLDGAADVSMLALSPSATRESLRQLSRAIARVAELEARLLSHAETVRVEEVDQSKNTGAWWAHATHHRGATGVRRMRLAHGLAEYPDVAAAMARGDLVAEQASVIVRALGQLSAEHRAAGCEELLTQAKAFDAKALKVIGDKVLEVIDPDAHEAREQKLLDDAERRAAAKTSLYVWERDDGYYQGRFTIPIEQGAKLRKALLDAASRPTSEHARGPAGAPATHAHVRGHPGP